MCPATAAVLWNVLIQRVRQVADAIDIVPVEGVGKLARMQVFVGQWRGERIMDSSGADL